MPLSKYTKLLYIYAQSDIAISDHNVNVFFRNRVDLFDWFNRLFLELEVTSFLNLLQNSRFSRPKCSRFRRPELHQNCVHLTLVKLFAIKQKDQPRIELDAENTKVLIENFNTFSCGETMKATMKIFSVDEPAAAASICSIMKLDEDRGMYMMHLLKIYLVDEFFSCFLDYFRYSKTTYTRYFFFLRFSDLSHLDFDTIIENDFCDMKKQYPDEVMFFKFFRKLDNDCFDDILNDRYPPLSGTVIDGYLTRYPLSVLSDSQMFGLFPNTTRNRLLRQVKNFFRRKKSPVFRSVVIEQFESIRKFGDDYFEVFCQLIRQTIDNLSYEELSLKDRQFFLDALLNEHPQIEVPGYCFEKPEDPTRKPTEAFKIPNSHLVCTVENGDDFQSFLDEMQTTEVVGIDSEWYSGIFYLHNPKQIEIFQVATFKKTFILDFKLLSDSISTEHLLNQFSDRFLTNENILKLGHSFDNDMDMLRYTWKNGCQTVRTFTISNYIELKSFLQEKLLISADNRDSLSELLIKITGKSLDKREQLSNWSVRPLRESQIHYAAADAYSLLVCYRIGLGDPIDENEEVAQLTQDEDIINDLWKEFQY